MTDALHVVWEPGDRLLPLVYDELRRIAARQGRRERAGPTLQPAVPAPNQLPVLVLDDVIGRLEKLGRRLAQLVEVCAFGGCPLEEAAEVLHVSRSTAKREWRTAKGRLTRELRLKDAR